MPDFIFDNNVLFFKGFPDFYDFIVLLGMEVVFFFFLIHFHLKRKRLSIFSETQRRDSNSFVSRNPLKHVLFWFKP